jgi:hypothetical protein
MFFFFNLKRTCAIPILKPKQAPAGLLEARVLLAEGEAHDVPRNVLVAVLEEGRGRDRRDLDVDRENIIKSTNESMETKLYSNLKKFFKYDSFKSETQKNAVFEIAKRKNDVYGILIFSM